MTEDDNTSPLTREQAARADALDFARRALIGTTMGLGSPKPVDPDALIAVATFIVWAIFGPPPQGS